MCVYGWKEEVDSPRVSPHEKQCYHEGGKEVHQDLRCLDLVQLEEPWEQCPQEAKAMLTGSHGLLHIPANTWRYKDLKI